MNSLRADSLVERRRCQNFEASSRLEWLDTNSAGLYALGTVCGVRTRRYHGLLNGPARPGAPSRVWLKGLEETLQLGGQRFLFHTQHYDGVVTPKGYEHLEEFRLAPHPQWLYRVEESSFTREFFLVEGLPLALVRYCCSDDAHLEVRPLVSGTHHHSLLRYEHEAPFRAQHTWDLVTLQGQDGDLFLRSDASDFVPAPDWYFRFVYEEERARGLDFREDLWSPGILRFALRADTWTYFAAGLEDFGPLDPLRLLGWYEAKAAQFPSPHTPLDRLGNAARHFDFLRGAQRSVIAGYPWFTDWGRDSFIALPGIYLAAGRLDEAAEVVSAFLAQSRDGLIPNRITDDGATPDYNSIDATLWLFIAVWQWLECGGDRRRFHDSFFPPMREILFRLEQGTLFEIHADPVDGLLNAGSADTQLTWMDARVRGVPVTPRSGKAVEINALWYNALRLMTDWSRERGEFPTEKRLGVLANRAISGFTNLFWNPARQCLFDVIHSTGRDESLRPNQLFALSLPYPLVIRSKGEQILTCVETHLLTPYGLRTLSPQDPRFQGRYEGGPDQRDAAYHQGTVWPWLMGPYVRACLRVRGRSAHEIARCRALLDPLLASLEEACLGQISEVYDGNPLHRPGGTPAQAWSVAELRWLLAKELTG